MKYKGVCSPISYTLVFVRAAGREALAGVLSSKARIKSISASGNLREATIRRKIALAGVICSSLTQLGDCNLVLNLLGSSIQQELVSSGAWFMLCFVLILLIC